MCEFCELRSLAFTENLNKRGGGGSNARKSAKKGGAGPKTKVSKGCGDDGVCWKSLRLVIDCYGDKRIGGVFVDGVFGGCSFCVVRL